MTPPIPPIPPVKASPKPTVPPMSSKLDAMLVSTPKALNKVIDNVAAIHAISLGPGAEGNKNAQAAAEMLNETSIMLQVARGNLVRDVGLSRELDANFILAATATASAAPQAMMSAKMLDEPMTGKQIFGDEIMQVSKLAELGLEIDAAAAASRKNPSSNGYL